MKGRTMIRADTMRPRELWDRRAPRKKRCARFFVENDHRLGIGAYRADRLYGLRGIAAGKTHVLPTQEGAISRGQAHSPNAIPLVASS